MKLEEAQALKPGDTVSDKIDTYTVIEVEVLGPQSVKVWMAKPEWKDTDQETYFTEAHLDNITAGKAAPDDPPPSKKVSKT